MDDFSRDVPPSPVLIWALDFAGDAVREMDQPTSKRRARAAFAGGTSISPTKGQGLESGKLTKK